MKPLFFFLATICCMACNNSKKENDLVSPPKQAMISGPSYEAISLLGDTLYASSPSAELLEQANEKKEAYLQNPDAIDNIIWHGRFTAYTGNYNEAIAIYSKGLEKYPNETRLLRHRGHRYITLRKFDKAIADLEKAAKLIEGTKDKVEPDGMPNDKNIPVSTLHGNIYYHLGLAYYLKHDLENALGAFKKALNTSNNPDNVVSTSHWLYMIHRRMGNERAAEAVVAPITDTMEVIENEAYHRACLFYKGVLELNEINNDPKAPGASRSALSYAVGNWLYYTGNAAQAEKVFEIMMEQDDWASFGYIAAESD
ncbi:hypothetical protein, partial [Altibacter sp.]